VNFTMAGPPPLWTTEGRHYRVHMPPDITVVTACEDFGCDQWRLGWETVVDEANPEQAPVALLIRSGQTGRTFTELRGTRDGIAVAVFRFPAHQRCFNEHRTRPGRVMVMRRGRIVREHASLGDLAEDYTEHMGLINQQTERG
jgi:hypothetical protein